MRQGATATFLLVITGGIVLAGMFGYLIIIFSLLDKIKMPLSRFEKSSWMRLFDIAVILALEVLSLGLFVYIHEFIGKGIAIATMCVPIAVGLWILVKENT